jgi:uncharacterized membrane protein
MKRVAIVLSLVWFGSSLVGCSKNSDGGTPRQGGTPGTDNSFHLSGGTVASPIKRGDSAAIKVTVERGNSFHNSVRIETKGPEKILATVDRNLVKEGESPDVMVRIRPDDDAPPGDYKVLVTATTDNGGPAHLELSVKVVKK